MEQDRRLAHESQRQHAQSDIVAARSAAEGEGRLTRQFGVIDAVWLDISPVPVDPRAFALPRAEHDDLRGQLLALGRAVGGGGVRVGVAGGAVDASITVLAGPGLEPRTERPFTFVAYGDGWDALCSAVEPSPRTAGVSLVPFGPLLAACLAAGMTFRYFHLMASPRTSDSSLWDFGQGRWSGGGSPALDGVQLPPAHLIGLGAVGVAFGLALASTPGVSGTLIGIDPQDTDATGRNRLLSAFYDEIGQSKVTLAARMFELTGIRFFPNVTRWPEYATDPTRRSPPEVRSEEDAFRYEWVISCVDRNIHRQNIARYLPWHVLSGSTDGLVAQATYYAMEGPCECLACNHSVPTYSLEGLIDELRGLALPERLSRYEAWDLPPLMQAAIDEYLSNPSCGHIAEAELRRLGVDGTTDWSVGFVSAATGVMLAALFSRCAVDGDGTAVGQYPERRLVFMGGQELLRSRAQRKPECDVCGSEETGRRFARRWCGRRGNRMTWPASRMKHPHHENVQTSGRNPRALPHREHGSCSP